MQLPSGFAPFGPREPLPRFPSPGFAGASAVLGPLVSRRHTCLAVLNLPLAARASASGTPATDEAITGDLQTVPGSGPTTEPPSIAESMEQIRVQTQVAPPDDGAGKAAPATHQYMIVMRHGQRIDEVDRAWSAKASRPFDPYLTEHGVEQARGIAAHLKEFDIKQIYTSPFLRCLQTTMYCAEGLGIHPQNWTVTCAVSEFLNPGIMVKKGGSVPPGNINEWFWEKGTMRSTISGMLPDGVKCGLDIFKRYPENLLNSRSRYVRAFQEMADEAEGQNVLIVTHGDGVNASVSRLRPWAVVFPVLHTGFTIARRDRTEDGTWSSWQLESKNGQNGVTWHEQLYPVYTAGSWVGKTYKWIRGR